MRFSKVHTGLITVSIIERRRRAMETMCLMPFGAIKAHDFLQETNYAKTG
jgi:hypothetical protein